MRFYSDDFNRHGDAALDATTYPELFGGAEPRIYDESVVRFEETQGIRWGWPMPTPDWAMEVTLNVAVATDLLAVYLFARYQIANDKHYAAVISFSDSPSNTYQQDATGDSPLLAAGKVYLFYFDGTDATQIGEAADFDVSTGVDYRLRLVTRGDRISFYIDGEKLLSETHAAWRTANWTFGTFGLGVDRTTSASGTSVVDFDDLVIETFLEYATPMAAWDELRRIVRFSLPAGGSGECEQIYNYHLDADTWTREDHATSCLGQIADPQGRAAVVYGEPADGKVYLIDGSATWSGSAIDCGWRSNWIQFSEATDRRRLEKVAAFIELASDLEAELIVEVADDPSQPRTYYRRQYLGRFDAAEPRVVDLVGRFCRVEVRHNDAGSVLRLRRLVLSLME